jgi:hypothetical protein
VSLFDTFEVGGRSRIHLRQSAKTEGSLMIQEYCLSMNTLRASVVKQYIGPVCTHVSQLKAAIAETYLCMQF